MVSTSMRLALYAKASLCVKAAIVLRASSVHGSDGANYRHERPVRGGVGFRFHRDRPPARWGIIPSRGRYGRGARPTRQCSVGVGYGHRV